MIRRTRECNSGGEDGLKLLVDVSSVAWGFVWLHSIILSTLKIDNRSNSLELHTRLEVEIQGMGRRWMHEGINIKNRGNRGERAKTQDKQSNGSLKAPIRKKIVGNRAPGDPSQSVGMSQCHVSTLTALPAAVKRGGREEQQTYIAPADPDD